MRDTILKEISKIVIPFIQIFGLYIISHGHLSPGGGFAGGTVIGASLILFRIVYGSEEVKQKLKYKTLTNCTCTSVILYGVMKGYSFITGGSHIDLPQPPLGTPGNILSGGYLLPLNILVGAIVAITMYFFYTLFDEGEV
ncbi:MAG: MnhB domain-containing protein [Clostridiaceae bacterium]|jgi:multicomponent Na+:H+ antiporter subunit B